MSLEQQSSKFKPFQKASKKVQSSMLRQLLVVLHLEGTEIKAEHHDPLTVQSLRGISITTELCKQPGQTTKETNKAPPHAPSSLK